MRLSILSTVLVFLVLSPVNAGDDKEKTTREAAIEAAETVVITNDVLEALYGTGVPGRMPEAKAKAEEPDLPDAERVLRDRAARQRSLRKMAADARKEVADAEAEVQRLERRALAVRNPFMPRPEITADEKEEWDRLDNTQRLRKTEEDLRTARERLKSARDNLARLERGS